MGVDCDQDTWFSVNFQYGSILLPKCVCLPPGLCPGRDRVPGHRRGLQRPRPQLRNVESHPCRGPHRIAGPGPRDPTIRHCSLIKLTSELCPHYISMTNNVIRRRTHVRIHMYTCARTHTHARACTHAHIRTHHVHAYTHTHSLFVHCTIFLICHQIDHCC